MSETNIFAEQLKKVVIRNVPQISTILPSDWTEQNMIMQKPFPGPFRYKRTPYTKEIIDILHPDNPIKTCNVKKGGQIGFSSGVIYPGICWIIKNNPGNTSLSVGSPDLISKAMGKVDASIDSTGIRDYIKPQAKRRRNNKSGDTNEQKDFSNGFLMLWSAGNHKNIRQVDLQYQFNDDFVAIKKASKESGSTRKKLDQRSAAYKDSRKTFNISTPELVGSNIDQVYEEGDKRRFFVPCPCCNDMIIIEWTIPSLKVPGKTAGITWKLNESGQIEKNSVGYICPLCDEFFDDKDKQTWLNKGEWIATAIPKNNETRSYHISALYAPVGMYDWEHYVGDYISANPIGQPRDESAWQQFMNEVLGESYSPPTESLKATELQKNNVRDYKVGEVPFQLSRMDGNGEIIMLTLAADANGKLEDARLDWELTAWPETGAPYSFNHGSIGTFIPNQSQSQKEAEPREKWSYELNAPNSVWLEFHKLVSGNFGGMGVFITAIDTGHCYDQIFSYIDSQTPAFNIVGVMGDKEHEWQKYRDVKDFTPGKSRLNLYLLNVNKMKDDLARQMQLKWDQQNQQAQPYGFMNFPTSTERKYDYKHYFSQFESEEKRENKEKGEFLWQKKEPTSQNHFWDVKIYGTAARDILMEIICKKEMKLKSYNWKIFADILMGRPVSE